METKQRSVRYHKWIHDQIQALAEERGKDFAYMVNFLLEDELNHLGYTRAVWESEELGIGRHDGNKDTGGKRRAQ